MAIKKNNKKHDVNSDVDSVLSSANKKTDYDLIIVGAGLVGATLAASIASHSSNQNIKIAVIDQGAAPEIAPLTKASPAFDPRVVALTQDSIKLFESIGAWSTIESMRACPYRFMRVWDNEGTGEISFDASELSQPQLGVIVENRILLSAVLAVLARLDNITLLRGESVSELAAQANNENNNKCSKRITLNNGQILQASLVIAADGAHSKIRELAGLKVRSWSYQQKAIVTTVKTENSHQDTAWQNFLVTGPLAFLPLDHVSKQYCSIVWSLDNTEADRLMALPDDKFKVELARAFQNRLGAIEHIDKRFCFPLTQTHAVSYIAPQIALVGDAAHAIHPLAGQGVNLGLLDAAALAAEITRASERCLPLSDESILRRYQRARKQNNLQLMALMESFKRLFGTKNLSVRWLRNTGIKKINKLTPVKKWLAKKAMGL
jgi:2-octaprenylphenol hydroxylase